MDGAMLQVRSELARQLREARRGRLDLLEAQVNVRKLSRGCEPDVLYKLLKVVRNQLQKIIGNKYYREQGLETRARISLKGGVPCSGSKCYVLGSWPAEQCGVSRN